MNWLVSLDDAGVRLSHFLQRKVTLSLAQVRQALELNRCIINGSIERFASIKLKPGDRVLFLPFKKPEELKLEAERLLFEDEYLLLYNKPAGVTSEPDGVPSLFPGCHLVHRLDRDTTGVILFAKTKSTYHKLFALFKERKIRKEYWAIVDQIPREREGTIENQLGKKGTFDGQTLWGETRQGVYAKTEWMIKKQLKKAALLRCFPYTGRTHQIRVHMKGMGHPILGDAQYSRTFTCPYMPTRTLLHAHQLQFVHPETERPLTITAPLPRDFQHALHKLGSMEHSHAHSHR